MQGLCNGRTAVHPSAPVSVPLIDICRLPQLGRGQQISIGTCWRRRVLAIDPYLQAPELQLRVASC